MNSADIHITKVEAARRQINAAIRMYFADIDELAIHTVIGAARNLVRDLAAKRGKNHYKDGIEYTIESLFRDRLRGISYDPKIKEFASQFDHQFQEIIGNLSEEEKEKIKSGGKLNFQVEIGDAGRRLWSESVRPINFLKHADRDHAKTLREDQIDNFERISETVSMYMMLDLKHSEEMCVWSLYTKTDSKGMLAIRDTHVDGKLASEIKQSSEEERKAFCFQLLEDRIEEVRKIYSLS